MHLKHISNTCKRASKRRAWQGRSSLQCCTISARNFTSFSLCSLHHPIVHQTSTFLPSLLQFLRLFPTSLPIVSYLDKTGKTGLHCPKSLAIAAETITMTDYASLKVPDLKKLLSERSLPQSGNKADLIARLQENDKSMLTPDRRYQASSAPPSTP